MLSDIRNHVPMMGIRKFYADFSAATTLRCRLYTTLARNLVNKSIADHRGHSAIVILDFILWITYIGSTDLSVGGAAC